MINPHDITSVPSFDCGCRHRAKLLTLDASTMMFITPQTLSKRDAPQIMDVSSFFPPRRMTFHTIFDCAFYLDFHISRPEERQDISSEVETGSNDT